MYYPKPILRFSHITNCWQVCTFTNRLETWNSKWFNVSVEDARIYASVLGATVESY